MLSSAGFASAALSAWQSHVQCQPSLAQMAGSLETRTVSPPSSRSRDCDWHAARGWIHRAVQMLLARDRSAICDTIQPRAEPPQA